jgi:cob(I)alamin adenosyltransferase
MKATPMNDSDKESEEKHLYKMKKKKAVIDARIANATEERGVLILMKGNGKGKSSSAFGTMARALGHGQRAGVVQFSKGRQATGEHLFFKDHPMVDFHVMGHGFTWETQDKTQDIAAAQSAWEIASAMLVDDQYDILVFDEMSYMFKYGYLDIEPVITALASRPIKQSVIITGRTMHRELGEVADTISKIEDVEHAFRKGVKAQPGIEW